MAIRIMVGDCREILPQFPNDYFHCVVTSPPFWGLRDYGIAPSVWGGEAGCEHEWGNELKPPSAPKKASSQFCQLCNAWLGCLGLEPTPELYVAHLVDIFREVKRVLRDDGTVWLNMGDSCNSRGGHTQIEADGRANRAARQQMKGANVRGLKPKDLCGIPWRIAFALQADGWWLRSAIVWQKPDCMPESVTDRPTNDYEFMFLLAKSKQYFYDQDAIREPQTGNAHSRGSGMNPKGALAERGRNRANDSFHASTAKYVDVPGGRNKRTVWTIPTYPYSEAHFATFPPALVEPCIKAGTSERGACPECGAGWVRVVESYLKKQYESRHGGFHAKGTAKGMVDFSKSWTPGTKVVTTIGFRPTCTCYNHRYRSEFPRARSARKRWQQDMADRWLPRARKRPGKDGWPAVPCRVLDPFSGAGTTGMVADRLGRDAVLIDIKAEYCEMARERIVEDAGPMFAQVTVEGA